MNKIRKGDEVIVTTGKDKGKRGIVLSVGDERVTVEGINLVKKHVKPNPMKGTTGVWKPRRCRCIFRTSHWLTRMARRRV